MDMTKLRHAVQAAAAWAAHWWQFTSVKLALLFGAIETLRSTEPEQYAQIVMLLPEPLRPLIGPFSLAVVLWARTRQQPGIKPKGGENGQ